MTGTGHTRARRRLLRDMGDPPLRCRYCGVEMWTQAPAPPERLSTLLTADHILPRALGGTNEPENLRALCWWCNAVRGALNHCTGALACALAVKGRTASPRAVHKWWRQTKRQARAA